MSTSSQPNLWSYVESLRARDEGMALSEARATEAWRASALEAVRRCALEHEYLTVDMIWQKMSPQEQKGELRRMGSVLLNACKAGYIAPTDTFVQTARKSSHAARIRKWRSLIHTERL